MVGADTLMLKTNREVTPMLGCLTARECKHKGTGSIQVILQFITEPDVYLLDWLDQTR